MLRLFFLLFPCLALAQYPKAMDFSKLYQGKLDSVAVVLRTGWTKETSWPEAPEEERITEIRKHLPLSEGNHLLRILRNKRGYKEEYPLLNDVVSSFLFYANGNEVLTIHFSTETKQLTMYKGDELIFAGMSKGKLTKKLIRYLYPKLSAKELYMNFFILWEEI
ncbi:MULTISPECIES: hypothetical protein [Capnocytophaga]|uniref:hypothetical protein n=1 Tax=Capnocytophaga TaxID=1016 RepID=UPI00020C7061|nr:MULTISPECIES: hypothetical protein [unclassified Capnocytophaga]KHE69061.1 hypothetical protein HMPREF9074_08697 [Capnocytophaga sp. oral taxon 329 str. F0087]QGS18214.1 hypothetical protein FOC45_08040 [Capnocytophaga sp. FDAARGOS_737]